MNKKSYIPSWKYAVRSIRRNYRRSFTLMFGVIISIAIISGILFYLDSTTDSLVETAFENVQIDTAISAGLSANETDMQEILEFATNESSTTADNLDQISGAELIIGTDPFGISWGKSGQGLEIGAIASPDSDYNLTMESLKDLLSNEGSLSVTYIIGIEPSYLETFPLFSTTDNVTQIFDNDQVLISQNLEYSLNDTDNRIDVSLAALSVANNARNLHVYMNQSLEVGGTFELNSIMMQESISAFELDQTSGDTNIKQSAQISNVILMSYSQYWSLFVNQTTMHSALGISFNAIHLKLDHSLLSTDLDIVYGELNQIGSTFGVYYPNLEVVNLLEMTLDQVGEQLNQMRLFLIYFALPGLLIGAYVSKYAIDLTLKERKKEIGLLRTKTAVRDQIVAAMGFESFLISTVGMGAGLISGYLASFVISNSLNGGGGLIVISLTSLGISVGIGLLIIGFATYFSAKQLLTSTITDTLKISTEQKPALWRRIYLDFILLGLALITIVLNYLEFDPTAGFATALYNLVAPFLAWIGLALLLVRSLAKMLQKFRKPIIKVYRLLFKDLSKVITKNILHRPEKISKITIVLSLTLSFGLVVSIINATYESGAQQDAEYQVGADIRLMFPDSGYLDYNTSDVITALEENFTQEISGTTAIFNSGIQLGKAGLLIIGIEPQTFFEVANVEDRYLSTNSIEGTQSALLDNSTGIYNNIIFSETVANPTSSQDASKVTGKGGSVDSKTQVFTIGESYPIRAGGVESEITVTDIAYHFPAIADLTGRADNQLTYAIMNVEFLKTPVINSNMSLLEDENATLSLIKLNEGYSTDEIVDSIYTWYAENYPSSSDINLIGVEEKLEEYLPLMSSLTGLTTMEFILVLAVSSLGLEIFIVSSLYDRKKEFGTYYAIGGSKRDVRRIVFGELLLITGFSLVSGLLLAGLISFMYLGFLSSLLVLSVSSLVIPAGSVVILISLVILATLLAIGLSGGKLAKLDPANILRTV